MTACRCSVTFPPNTAPSPAGSICRSRPMRVRPRPALPPAARDRDVLLPRRCHGNFGHCRAAAANPVSSAMPPATATATSHQPLESQHLDRTGCVRSLGLWDSSTTTRIWLLTLTRPATEELRNLKRAGSRPAKISCHRHLLIDCRDRNSWNYVFHFPAGRDADSDPYIASSTVHRPSEQSSGGIRAPSG